MKPITTQILVFLILTVGQAQQIVPSSELENYHPIAIASTDSNVYYSEFGSPNNSFNNYDGDIEVVSYHPTADFLEPLGTNLDKNEEIYYWERNEGQLSAENINLLVVSVTGELKQYHKTTLTFDALNLSEAPSTYLDNRMNVLFTSPTGIEYLVPGYFAADGNAAETSATSGNKWRCHINPKETGTWTYSVSFRTGTNIAVSTDALAGTATSIDGETGSFTITATDKIGDDFRAKGKLQYIGTDTAQFDNGNYYFEVGADSPETFLEYADFDATPARHDFTEVASNYVVGDPSWQSGKGTEIIGAVNYLANQGMNVHYFLTMNITGDGKRAYPFPNTTDYTTYDCSKLDQWQIVFDHMYNKGLAQEFVLTETENLNWFEDQEGIASSNFSTSRKLYYREMIARFGYLNCFYNIGEEANWNVSGDVYTAAQIEEAANYIQSLTPYNDLITVHNGPASDVTIFPQLTSLPGTSSLTAISMQGDGPFSSFGHDELLTIKNLATANGKEWVVRYTEPFYGSAPNLEQWTERNLWGMITAGGTGVHYYSYNGDVTNDNYTDYVTFYQRMKIAKDFLYNNNVPFWEMANNDGATSRGTMLSKTNSNHVIFLPTGGSPNVNLGASGTYTIKWFDPRNGGSLQDGSVTSITADNTSKSLGNAPGSTSSSWVIYAVNESLICEADFEEQDGIVVIEAESIPLVTGWNLGTTSTGFTGDGYIVWNGGNFFNTPGMGTIQTTIKINTPGTYLFQWRSRIGAGTSTTDNNDTWVRFNDASEFYAVLGGSTIYPQGSGQTPVVNGAGGDNWFKVYASSLSWTWQTRTNDNTPYAIFVDFDSPGVYTMEISGRSQNHFIDRIVLSASGNQDLGLTQTVCGETLSISDLENMYDVPKIKLYPVPFLKNDTYLNVSGLSEGDFSLSIYTLSGQKITSEIIKVTNGTYAMPIDTIHSNGIYLLTLESIESGEKIHKRFIIQR